MTDIRQGASGPIIEVPGLGPGGPVSVLDYLVPGGTIVQAINAAFADSSVVGVYFPALEYVIDDLIVSELDGKSIYFVPGAVLQIATNPLAEPTPTVGSFEVAGDHTAISGYPTVSFDEDLAEGIEAAVNLQGVGCTCERLRFEINASVSDVSLLRLSGDYSTVGPVTFAGTGGAFGYGVELAHDDGTAVLFARYGLLTWEMEDDGVTTYEFDALVRYRSSRSQGGPIALDAGGRHAFTAIVEVDGTHNSLLDPQVNSSGADFGVLQKDDAEFFAIYGGELVGNYRADSVGISCGDGSKVSGAPAVGQLKLFDTKVRNWDYGVRILGTADTPTFVGATIANNKVAQIEIDSKRGSDVWPVSGLCFVGCYSEDVAFPGVPFLLCTTGSLFGLTVAGCEIGYTGTAFLVESTFGVADGDFSGNRFPANGGTDAVTTPNTLSLFYFGRNSSSGSNLIGKGAFAANAMSAFDPTLTGLVIGASNPGSLTNRMISSFTDIYTANFGNVAAGATVSLDFSFPAVPTTTTAELNVSMSGALGAKALLGIIFQWWIDSSGHIFGTAWNPTLAPINAVSGGVRFTITVFG